MTLSIGGTISEVLVTDTQAVKKGRCPRQIDQTDARLALAQAEADLGRAIRRVKGYVANDSSLSAQIAAREADEKRAAAQLDSAQADFERATIDLKRREALVASGSVSGDELTRAKKRLCRRRGQPGRGTGGRGASAGQPQHGARLARSERRADRRHDRGDEPEVALARARRDQAAVDLERTVVLAPVDGIVAKRQVQLGQRVQAGMAASPGGAASLWIAPMRKASTPTATTRSGEWRAAQLSGVGGGEHHGTVGTKARLRLSVIDGSGRSRAASRAVRTT